MNKETRTPRRGPMGHDPGMRGATEKAKDFKGAMKRLFKELNIYKILLTVSFTLAIVGAILSISAPNILSKLTDEISEGLKPNKENIEKLSVSIQNNLDQTKIIKEIPSVLKLDLSEETVFSIMKDKNISGEDKKEMQSIMKKMNSEKQTFEYILEFPESIKKIILKETEYNGEKISYEDKIEIINLMKNFKKDEMKSLQIPESIQGFIFDEIEIDGIKISSKEQYEFISAMSSLGNTKDASIIYSKIDEMPENIKKIIEPKMDMTVIKKIVFFLIGLYGLSAVCTYIQSISMTVVANRFARSLRRRISHKINKLPLMYFDNHSTGDILSRITNDVDTIAQSMNQSLASLVTNITLFLGTIVMMFYTNWILALTAILSSLVGFAGMSVILKSSQKYFTEKQRELGNLNGHIEEIYSGLNVVKVYNGKKESDKKFDEYNKKVCISNQKSQFLSGLMHPLMGFIGNFGYVAVCVMGAVLTINNVISFGVIVAFMTYVRLFTNPLSQIAQSMTSLQSTGAASERVFEFLDEKEMIDQKEITKKLKKSEVKGDIEFKNIIFQYEDADAPTIKNFTAKAKHGQKIAIVGPTGAGKTTMVNLLMKFYDINNGDIKIDGISTKELTRENIHELFTMVLQDTWLFNGTVKENIIYNRDNISDERVKEVCKEVGLDHFIRTLPKGYNSLVSENENISAGQRQLLTIARGMIEDAPFLILDEATSNVDTRTEELVQIAMDKLTEGRTSFIIAHRLSTIKNADIILVMKEGNIIEQGNHDELISKNGFYAELYNSQFEL